MTGNERPNVRGACQTQVGARLASLGAEQLRGGVSLVRRRRHKASPKIGAEKLAAPRIRIAVGAGC